MIARTLLVSCLLLSSSAFASSHDTPRPLHKRMELVVRAPVGAANNGTAEAVPANAAASTPVTPAGGAQPTAAAATTAPVTPTRVATTPPAASPTPAGVIGGLLNSLTAGAGTVVSGVVDATPTPATTPKSTPAATTKAATSSIAAISVPSSSGTSDSSSSPSSSATAAASNSSSSSSGLHGATLIAVIVASSVVGGIAIIWTIVRKWKLGTSKKFSKKLSPIDEFDPHGADDFDHSDLPGHGRGGYASSLGRSDSGERNARNGPMMTENHYAQQGGSYDGSPGQYAPPSSHYPQAHYANNQSGYSDAQQHQYYPSEQQNHYPDLQRGPSQGYSERSRENSSEQHYGGAYNYEAQQQQQRQQQQQSQQQQYHHY